MASVRQERIRYARYTSGVIDIIVRDATSRGSMRCYESRENMLRAYVDEFAMPRDVAEYAILSLLRAVVHMFAVANNSNEYRA